MKRVQNRTDLKNKVLLTLGHPYIRVDLSDEHLDNAIDTALRYFFKNSNFGSFESHYIYQVTADDVTNGYIPVPRYIDAVVEVIGKGMSISDLSFATAEYQMTKETFMAAQRFTNYSLVDYVCLKERLYNTEMIISQPKGFEFVKYQRRLIPYFNFPEDSYIVMKCYENVDPEADDVGKVDVLDASDLWDDEVLKDLVIAEAKMTWGYILRKFGQVVLPGGVTLDGQKLYEEGKADSEAIKEQMLYSNPVDFFMG